MKNKFLKIVPIIFILIGILSVSTYAVTYTSTDCSVESGGDISITISASENVQNYDVSLSSHTGLTYVSCSANENAAVNQSTGAISYATLGSGTTNLGTYKFKAPEVSEDSTYNVVFNINGISNTAKVTVKAKEQTPVTPVEPENPTEPENPIEPENPTNPEVPSNPETPNTPETPTVTEPTFTSVNETVYATGSINVRESYNTSSKIVGKLQKGEEVTRTGKGSNGWSRVTYKGATAYISSSLLTMTKPEEEKSNNANLKSLTVEGKELNPTFSAANTQYTMQVENNVTELNIKAVAEDEKATIEIKGNKELKEGENTVTISVNAEDNTIKIYEIKVTKLAEKTSLGLQSLKIKNTNIGTLFEPDVYEYEIDVKNVTKLEIEAIANDETATVEILGNEDLQEGENLITIMVSSQNGEEKVTYQIKANKLVAEVKTTPETKTIDPKIYVYVGIGVVLLIALAIVIVYTIKHRNQEEYDDTDIFEGFPEELPERQEDLEETQEINDNNEEVEVEDMVEEQNIEDRKAKINYFLDDIEDDEKPRYRRGKHF